jgi:hypothetical protein
MASNPFEDPSIASASGAAEPISTPSWANEAAAAPPVPPSVPSYQPPSADGTPSWTVESAVAPAPAPAAAPRLGSGPVSTTEINAYTRAIRYVNIIVAVLYITAAILAYPAGKVDSAPDFFATGYSIFFGGLLLAFEMSFTKSRALIAKNFGFMNKAWGRAFYLLYMGTLPLNLGDFGMAVGIVMIVNAVLNLYVVCKFPIARQTVTPQPR